MRGHVHSPTGQSDPDQPEVLSGPGDQQKPRKPAKKTVVIAASALVAVLAAGGIGFALAAGSPDAGSRTTVSGPAGQDDKTGTGQDVAKTEGPVEDGAKGDAPDDGSMGDATVPETGDSGTGDSGTGDTGTGDSGTGRDDTPADTGSAGASDKKDDSKGKEPTPGTGQQEVVPDSPADGPPGMISGQCAKSGC